MEIILWRFLSTPTTTFTRFFLFSPGNTAIVIVVFTKVTGFQLDHSFRKNLIKKTPCSLIKCIWCYIMIFDQVSSSFQNIIASTKRTEPTFSSFFSRFYHHSFSSSWLISSGVRFFAPNFAAIVITLEKLQDFPYFLITALWRFRRFCRTLSSMITVILFDIFLHKHSVGCNLTIWPWWYYVYHTIWSSLFLCVSRETG